MANDSVYNPAPQLNPLFAAGNDKKLFCLSMAYKNTYLLQPDLLFKVTRNCTHNFFIKTANEERLGLIVEHFLSANHPRTNNKPTENTCMTTTGYFDDFRVRSLQPCWQRWESVSLRQGG